MLSSFGPCGMLCEDNSDSVVYVANYGKWCVSVFTEPEGRFLRSWKGPHEMQPRDFALHNNTLYVSEQRNTVQLFSPSGEFLFKFGSYGKNPGQFQGPRGMCVMEDIDGGGPHLFVADFFLLFSLDGKFVREFGSHGEQGGPAFLHAICDDQLLVSAPFASQVQRFEKNGNFHSILVGDPKETDTRARLSVPRAITTSSDGELFVVDSSNSRVVVFD